MDGTLTRAVHDFNDIRRQLALPPDQPILESIDQLPAEQAAATHQKLHAIEMDIARQAQSQPGAEALLEKLNDRGCQTAILTRNGKDIAIETLRYSGLLKYFPEHLVISRDCCAAKPAPDGVHLLLQHWQAKATESVMVGDYHFDLAAGAAAGTETIHLDVTEKFSWPELTSLAISSLTQLTVALDHKQ